MTVPSFGDHSQTERPFTIHWNADGTITVDEVDEDEELVQLTIFGDEKGEVC